MLTWQQQQGLMLFNAHCNNISNTTTCQNYRDDGITKSGLKKRKTDEAHIDKLDDGDEEKKKKAADPKEMQAIHVPKLETKGSKLPAAAQKTDYIHVRARRGQATDSHSLAERVRREKISERMKHLQDLVPGCNNITGKASVLDEIINYVQSLQKQVEFLSMKLASVDPLIDCNMQSFMEKEISSACSTSISRDKPSDLLNPSSLLFNPSQQAISSCHNEFGVTTNLLEHVISAPVSVPDTFSEPFFDVCGSSAWDGRVQEFCNVDCSQGRGYSNPFHLFPATDDNNPM